MNLIMTVMKEGDDCHFFADTDYDDKFTMTAKPVVFARRALFTRNDGEPMLVLPLADAKKMAEEILRL